MKKSLVLALAAIAAAATLASLPAPARADDVDEAAQRVTDLANRVQELDNSVRPPLPASADEADRRLIDAEVQYNLRNYDDASILLYDIVQKYPSSDAYSEALWYLADCLYRKGDYITARQYLEQLIQGYSDSSTHYQEALAEVLEISVKTKDEASAQDALQRLEAIPQGQQNPLVPYARGKFAFAESQFDDAASAFESIPQDSPYYFRGQYFLGATYVAQNDLPNAAKTFAALTTAQPASQPATETGAPNQATDQAPDQATDQGATDQGSTEPAPGSDQSIINLAHLALGRVLYERGELDKAATEYQAVDQHSPQFVDALYEIAWVFVKGGDYKRALQAIDLCLLADPSADTVAEAELLQGNLEIRLAEESDSTVMFQKVKSEFQPMREQIDQVLAKNEDPVAFFQRIVSTDTTLDTDQGDVAASQPASNPSSAPDTTDQIDASSLGLPPLAVKWIREAPEVQRVTTMVTDETEIQQDLSDADTTIARLEQVVNSPEKVNIFPDLAKAAEEASTISNQLTLYQEAMAQRYHDLVAPVATPDQQQQLAALENQRNQLDADLATLPQSSDSLDERIAKEKSRYDALQQEQAEIKTTIEGVKAEMAAIRTYYLDTKDQQHESQADFDKDSAAVQTLIDQLNQSYNQVNDDIANAENSIGVMDQEAQSEEQLKTQYAAIVQQEQTLEQQMEASLSGSDKAKADQINSVLAKITDTQQAINALNEKIDGLVDQQLVDVKSEIEDAKTRVATYKTELVSYQGETNDVGSGEVMRSTQQVANHVYDIVVRSDVGLVDVAWALKQEKMDAYKQVADEEARQIKLMDQQYQDVLQDTPTGVTGDSMSNGGGGSPSSGPTDGGSN
jgi:tetratricopeptide (TPR) repeat protein